MSNPTAWYDGLYADQQDLWLAVDSMLLLMVKGGMPMPKERGKVFNLEDPETIGVYVYDLHQVGVTAEDVAADGHLVRNQLRYFPSSGELANAMRQLRDRRRPPSVIHDPVYVEIAHPLYPGVALTSKAVAVRKGIPYWETERLAKVALGLAAPVRELPEGVNIREYTLDRLNGLADRMTANRALPVRRFARTPEEQEKMRDVMAELDQRRDELAAKKVS